jgi:hypothetical protein
MVEPGMGGTEERKEEEAEPVADVPAARRQQVFTFENELRASSRVSEAKCEPL